MAGEQDIKDIAEKALRADLANVLKKVKAGKPLTDQERRLLRSQQDAGKSEDERQWLANIDDICDVFGISRRSYLRRKDEPGYPRKTKRGYSVEKVRAFLEKSGLVEVEDEGALNKDVEHAKRIRVQRLIAEVELARRRGELIAREDHNRELTTLINIVSTALTEWQARIASDFRKQAEVVTAAERTVDDLRGAMAEAMELEAERLKKAAEDGEA